MGVPLKNRHKVIPAAYIVFRSKDKVLLLKREHTDYFDGYYSLPAGHIEGGESALAAAKREAKEEVGADIDTEELQLVHFMHRRSDIPSLHERVDFYFQTNKPHPELTNREPEKCSELRWADFDNLPENIVPEVKIVLQKISTNQPYSDLNF